MGSLELQASSGLATVEWHGINWAACQRRVRSLQRRIVQAVQAGAWRKVKRLSYLLVHSFAARALAVKRVTENQGKKTPGMDGELWDTPEKKVAGVERIGQWRGYRPVPLKRIYIPKKNVAVGSDQHNTWIYKENSPKKGLYSDLEAPFWGQKDSFKANPEDIRLTIKSTRPPSLAGDLSVRFQYKQPTGAKMKTRHFPSLAIAALLMAYASAASAHEGAGITGGFISGFLHPVLGWDHVVAMVAVGLWGAFLGSPAIWILPVVFPLVMAFGGALGVIGVPIPAVETGIAASAVVLGAMVAFAVRPPIWVAAVIVGAFAIFHGHAHGTELPNAANPLAYSIGFVLSTGLLHLSGIAFGLLVRWPAGKVAVQAGGGLIALAGVGFLTGIV